MRKPLDSRARRVAQQIGLSADSTLAFAESAATARRRENWQFVTRHLRGETYRAIAADHGSSVTNIRERVERQLRSYLPPQLESIPDELASACEALPENIRTRVYNCLRRGRYETAMQVCQTLSADLRLIGNLGERSLRALRAVMPYTPSEP